MSSPAEQRKLAAIMFTDMVGYSALSQRDDKLALELLEEHRELLRKIFPEFNGTEIKTIGDAFLVEFNSALEAAQCAIAIQRALAKRDADAPAERQIQVRIGIHIGDVVHRADDVYGDGVNIASRIEPLADAGGICVSMDVERQIRNTLETRLEKLAPTELKNISVPMDLFRIVLPWEKQAAVAAPSQTTPKARSNRGLWIAALIIATVLIAGATGLYVFSRRPGPKTPPSAIEPAPVAIPEKSIAVLPFENLSRDPDNAFFTDGVQDEILTDLAKIADLKVISRTSVMQYKTGTQRNLREIGQQLGVAHLVEGSVQRAGNKVRVNAQLIEARNDAHLWAQTYDRDLADVFAIQSEIAKAIADQLKAKLSPDEKAAIQQRPTADLTAFEEYSRAKSLLLNVAFSTTQQKQYLQAVALLNSAVTRDPSFYAAHCLLAATNDNYYALMDHVPERLALAETALKRVTELRPDASETHLARATHLYFALRDYNAAKAELDAASSGLPNDPRVFELTGYILRRQGRHEEGLHALERAVALDPRNKFILNQLALSYDFLRRYAEEKEILSRCLDIDPTDPSTKCQRAQIDLVWKANPRPLHEVIAQLRTDQAATMTDVADLWFMSALSEHDSSEAEQALIAVGDNLCWGDGAIQMRQQIGEGLLARANHDETRAHSAFTAARSEQEKIVQKQQSYGPAVMVLALIDAGLGNKQLALEEGQRALQLLPVEKDSVNAQRLVAYFGIVAAWVGDRDTAFECLTKAAPEPGSAFITSYGVLKLLPFWDPLRGDPRFEKIVQSLAPKDNAK